MQSDILQSFCELCARTETNGDIETVGDIVDRLLRKDTLETRSTRLPVTGHRQNGI
jgi:hypothetical protein